MKKKIATLGVAAVMAVASLGLAGEASAHPMFWPHPGPPPIFWGHPHPHSGFYFGFNFGPPIYSYPAYPYPGDWRFANPHVRWCAENYRTYSPYTDTYHPKIGLTAQCISPWWTYR